MTFIMIIYFNNIIIKGTLLFVGSLPILSTLFHFHAQAYNLNSQFLVDVIQWVGKQTLAKIIYAILCAWIFSITIYSFPLTSALCQSIVTWLNIEKCCFFKKVYFKIQWKGSYYMYFVDSYLNFSSNNNATQYIFTFDSVLKSASSKYKVQIKMLHIKCTILHINVVMHYQ